MGLRAFDSADIQAPGAGETERSSMRGLGPGSGPGTAPDSGAAPTYPAAGPSAAWLLFLVTFVALGALPNQSLFWDDIGFLQMAADGRLGDLAHVLYPPLIRLASWLVSPFGLGLEAAARVLSALGGGLVAALAFRRARDLGISGTWAASASFLLIGAHLAWRQGSIVEPSTLALAALFVTGERAQAYGRTRSSSALAWLLAAAALSLSLHVVTLVALPWWTARAQGSPLPRSHRRVFAIAIVIAGLLFLLIGPGPAAFLRRALSYVPSPESEFPFAFTANLTHLFAIVREGAPCLGLAALLGLSLAIAQRARPSIELGALLVPHLFLFAIFGKPVVALSLPLFVVLFEIAARGIRRIQEGPAGIRALASIVLPILATIGLGHSLRHAFHVAAAPDPRREKALAVAEKAPTHASIVAGPMARHLSWWTEIEVIELPELMHQAAARGERPTDARAVRALLPRQTGRELWVSREAIDYLAAKWRIDAARWLPEGRSTNEGLESTPEPFFPFPPAPDSGEE